MSLGPITRVCPVPRRVTLGDRDYLVGEFRLIDLAELQAWLDESHPDPFDVLDERVQSAETDEARQRAVAEAYALAERGPSLVLGDGEQSALETTEGRLRVLSLALSRYQPELTELDVVTIEGQLGPGQYAKLYRVLMAIDAEHTLARMLGAEPLHGGVGRPPSWGELIDDLARSHGWTYDDIFALTLSQFANARSGGKRVEMAIQRRPGETQAQAAERQRRLFREDARPAESAS